MGIMDAVREFCPRRGGGGGAKVAPNVLMGALEHATKGGMNERE